MDANKNELLKDILRFDALSKAEEITGKSYKNDKTTESLGFSMHIKHCKEKNELLKSIGDSTFSNTESDYLNIVNFIGFKSILIESFINTDGIEERLHILWHNEFSILLVFDTFTYGDDGSWAKAGKSVPPPSVNGGNFYYNWSPKKEYDYSCTSSGGFCCNGDKLKTYSSLFNSDFSPHILPKSLRDIEPKFDIVGYEKYKNDFKEWRLIIDKYIDENKLVKVYSGHHDCREAIKFKISQLVENGNFVKQWKESPSLWLLHYMDTKKYGYDYKKINKERISRFPQEVKTKINYKNN